MAQHGSTAPSGLDDDDEGSYTYADDRRGSHASQASMTSSIGLESLTGSRAVHSAALASLASQDNIVHRQSKGNLFDVHVLSINFDKY